METNNNNDLRVKEFKRVKEAIAGDRPLSVLEQEAEIEALLNDPDGPGPEPKEGVVALANRTQRTEAESGQHPAPEPARQDRRPLPPRQAERLLPTRKAILKYVGVPSFTLEFEIFDIDIGDPLVSLDIAHNFVFTSPEKMMFNLTVEGKTYPVTFVGGVLRFASRGINAITFLRDHPRQP